MSILVLRTNAALEYAADHLAKQGLEVTESPDGEVRHLLLPVPSFARGSKYITPVLAALPKSVTVSGGNLDHLVLEGYRKVDFLRDPYYLAANAAITAKCAVSLMGKDPRKLPVLILGWGRIGKCLGQQLRQLGADVTIAARKDSDLAMIQALGASGVPISEVRSELPRFLAVFNTVPEMILPDMVRPPDCIAIELASKPGMSGDGILSARGLPGRYAPEESGRLIAETFLRLSFGKEDTL
ncbi:MAG: hypothetical protein IJ375_02800 [Oscillospiraceae bacterium]|nr:hypothetical protein [Oscillospiraceae bacterium]